MAILDRVRDPGERALAAVLLAPAFALLALIVVYPIGRIIYQSFFDARLSGGHGHKFVGFDNYAIALHDAEFWTATWHTPRPTTSSSGSSGTMAP